MECKCSKNKKGFRGREIPKCTITIDNISHEIDLTETQTVEFESLETRVMNLENKITELEAKKTVNTIEYGHRVPKTINVNVSVNLDNDLDIESAAIQIVERLGERLDERLKETKEDKVLKNYGYRIEDLTVEEMLEQFKKFPELFIEKLKLW